MSTTPGMIPEESVDSAEDSGNDVDERLDGVPEAGGDTQADTSETNDTSGASEAFPSESYKVTLVLVTRKGALVTKVVDSRSDDIEEAWEQMRKSKETEETVYRLILAEDLPGATERLLEKVLNGDCKILVDHVANDSNIDNNSNYKTHAAENWQKRYWQDCFRETEMHHARAELHINISEPPGGVSVSLPYVIHGIIPAPVAGKTCSEDSHLARPGYHEVSMVTTWSHIKPCGIRTSWLEVDPYGDYSQFLHIAYRRISVQHASTQSQELSLSIILLYPPIPLIERRDTDYTIPTDLAHPSPSTQTKLSNESPTNTMGTINMPSVSASLVLYFATQLGHSDQTSASVRTTIAEWMLANTRATFRESVKASIDYWRIMSMNITNIPLDDKLNDKLDDKVDGKLDFIRQKERSVDQFHKALITQIRQLERAKAEISRSAPTEDSRDLDHHDWQRMETSLKSILADLERMLNKRIQNLQLKMTNVQIEESRTAIRQAETVKRLTTLAFIFIPISATCSAFGMNIQELADRPPPVWVSLFVMLGVTLTTIVCSLKTTHNVLWAISRSLGPLKHESMAWRARIWLRNRMIDEDLDKSFAPERYGGTGPHEPYPPDSAKGAKPRWPYYPNYSLEVEYWPVRQSIRLVRLLYYLCRLPLAAVQRYAWTGAQYKKRRQKLLRYGGDPHLNRRGV